MNVLLVCLILTSCIVYIWDVVNFPNELASEIMEWLTKGKIKRITLKKPLGCSLCMTTWITFFILLFTDWKLLPFCLLFGWSTNYLLSLFQLIDLVITKILVFCTQCIDK